MEKINNIRITRVIYDTTWFIHRQIQNTCKFSIQQQKCDPKPIEKPSKLKSVAPSYSIGFCSPLHGTQTHVIYVDM